MVFVQAPVLLLFNVTAQNSWNPSFGRLDLNGRVINAKLVLKQACDLVESFTGWSLGHDVGRQDGFFLRKRPNMEVVYFVNTLQLYYKSTVSYQIEREGGGDLPS